MDLTTNLFHGICTRKLTSCLILMAAAKSTSDNPTGIQSDKSAYRSLTSSLGSHPEFDDHEEVVQCEDSRTGLRALIAVHSTRLGPSLGGCRMWSYHDEADAMTDVLRLSKAMSYKHAIAGTGRGGGKAVILGDSHKDKTPALMNAFGQFVDSLSGRYITAEDVGMSVDDMLFVKETTQHVSGLPIEHGGSGDPSPMTAYGVYCGIIAALSWIQGQSDADSFDHDVVKNRVVAVQGLGHVGKDLCRQLHESGAKLIVSDVDQQLVEQACDEFNARAVSPQAILTERADVFAPCALGGVLTAASIPRLQARIVAGAANNQLGTPDDGALLHRQQVLYAPDFVINAGGIINIANEQPTYDEPKAKAQTQRISETLWQIFTRSKQLDRPTAEIAEELARERLGDSSLK